MKITLLSKKESKKQLVKGKYINLGFMKIFIKNKNKKQQPSKNNQNINNNINNKKNERK